MAAPRLPQPSVSKHLRVLHDVGLGSDALPGPPEALPNQRRAIRPLQRGATFERYWQHQLIRVKEFAEATVHQGSTDSNSPNPKP